MGKEEFSNSQVNKFAVEEALKMLRIPMRDLPNLALEYLKYLSEQYGCCTETCLTAFSGYNQMVLKMECEDDLYKITCPHLLQWWENKGYVL